MNIADVIKKSILSEKAYKQMEAGIYTFLVDRQATKSQIAKAVQTQFDVKVQKVRIATKAPKPKRIAQTRKFTQIAGGKKALVQLISGQNIAALSPKSKKETKGSKKAEGPERSRREKDVQKF